MSDKLKQAEQRLADVKALAAAESAALKQAQRDLKAALVRADTAEEVAARVPGLEADLALANSKNAARAKSIAALEAELAKAAVKADKLDAIKSALA